MSASGIGMDQGGSYNCLKPRSRNVSETGTEEDGPPYGKAYFHQGIETLYRMQEAITVLSFQAVNPSQGMFFPTACLSIVNSRGLASMMEI